MTKWVQKKASINRSISIDCETIEYLASNSNFIRTQTGYVESKNQGTLIIRSKQPISQPLPDAGIFSFDDNNKLITFEIFGIIKRDEYSVVFTSSSEE